jgi:hypothetical protein
MMDTRFASCVHRPFHKIVVVECGLHEMFLAAIANKMRIESLGCAPIEIASMPAQVDVSRLCSTK